MRQNRLKRYTIWLMGALGAMLVLWASFGSRGDATETAVALENEDVAPAESATAPTPEPKAAPEPKAKPEAPAQKAVCWLCFSPPTLFARATHTKPISTRCHPEA